MEASDDLIKDFDNEVANRCKLIREGAENVSNNMLNALDLTLLSIPECVRKMTVKALVQNFNGDMQKAVQYFAPQKSTPKKKHHNGKSRNSPNLPLSNSQTQSLSELLKKKASEQSNATLIILFDLAKEQPPNHQLVNVLLSNLQRGLLPSLL